MDMKLENLAIVVYICFVIHNICEKHNIYVDKTQVKIQMDVMRQNEKDHLTSPDPMFSCNSDEGEVISKELLVICGFPLFLDHSWSILVKTRVVL